MTPEQPQQPYQQPQQPQYQVTQVTPDFGWAAPMPAVAPTEMRPSRPATLTAASWVWLLATVLGVVSAPLLMYVNGDPIVEGMVTDSTSATTLEGAQATLYVLMGMVLVGTLLFSVAFVIPALKLRSGRHWARVLLAVLGPIALVYNLALFTVAVTAPNWQLGVVLVITTAGLTLAGCVLMFLPPSNAYISLVGG